MTSFTDIEVHKLLSEVYCSASKDIKSDMLLTAEALEFIRKELINTPFLSVWTRLSLKRIYDTPLLTSLLVKLKQDYFEAFYQSTIGNIKSAYKENEEKGWNLWFRHYISALLQWRGEVYDRLCREVFPHPSSKKSFIERLQKLNRWILETRWADCHEVYLEIIQTELISNEECAHIEVILGQIELYWFPNYADSIQHFENAKKLYPDSARVVRGFAEYYLKLGENEKSRGFIFNAMSLDNRDIDNYLLMGDTYRDEGNTSVAEQWYTDGINFNFLDSSSYSRFFGLYNDEIYFKEAATKENNFTIDDLLAKISQLDPDSIYNNVLYDAYRSAANAFFINDEIDQAEKYYTHAIEMHPAWIVAYIDLAYVLASNKQTEKAKVIFEKALKIDKDCFDLNWNLAWMHEQEDDIDAARDFYIKCLKIRPSWSASVYQVIDDLYYNKGRQDELIPLYELMVKENPGVENRMKLADAYEKLNQYNLAKDQYTEVLKLKNSYAPVWNRIGNIFYKDENFKEAANSYKHAAEYDASVAVYYKNLGLAYRQLEDWANSKDAYLKAFELNAADNETLNAIGIAFYMLRDYKAAREWYNKAIEAAPAQDKIAGTYWANIGLTYCAEENWEEGRTAYEKAHLIDDKNPDHLKGLGNTQERMFDYYGALQSYKNALAINPADEYFNNRAGICCYRMNSNKEAIKYYKKAIEANAGFAVYYDNLGLSYKEMQQWEDAAAAYIKAIQLQPEAERYNLLGIVYYDMGDQEKAIDNYKTAISLQDNVAVYYSNLALSYDKAGYKKEAEKAYLKTLEIEPDNSNYHNSMGVFYYFYNEFEQAIEYYKKAIQLEKKEIFFDNLALAYEASAQSELALATYREGAQLYPHNELFKIKADELSKNVNGI